MDQTPEPPRASGWGEGGAVREAPLHGSNLISLILFHRFRAPTGARTPSSERPACFIEFTRAELVPGPPPAGGASKGFQVRVPRGACGVQRASAPRSERAGQEALPPGSKDRALQASLRPEWAHESQHRLP